MLETVLIRPDQHLYRYKSLLFTFQWDEFRLEHMVSITGACETVVREHGQMSSVIVMRGETNIDLSNDMRKAASNMISRFDSFNIGQAIVIEADGFRASMARSVITGINLLARAKAKQRVFQSPHEAVVWISALESQPPEIRDAVDQTWPAFEKLINTLRKS